VKLIRTNKSRVVFGLGHHEKRLLLAVLRLYPQIPPAYQPLARSAPAEASSQQLLDEALAEHRAETKQQLNCLLTDPKKLAEAEFGWELSLSSAEVEWLLQALNDIRVGSWAVLGSPEDCAAPVNEATLPHLWAMKMAGGFQMEMLEALEGGS
jgi:hypothetical protein